MERIGLIDIGSNTARLVIFDVLDGGYFTLVEEMREAVRLGETEKDGSLKATRAMQAINTLKTFKKVCAVYNVDRIVAMATAAVRRARNKRTFLNEIYNITGIKVRELSETEEATYVYQGVINSMDIPKGLIMEIGGGSTKLVYYNRRNILQVASFPFGAVTLMEMFNDGETKSVDIADKIEVYVKERLDTLGWLKELDPDTQLIGVGGSFRNLARIIRRVTGYPLDMLHNYPISKADIINIHNKLKGLDFDKKMRIKGISSVRADVFPYALTAIKAFVEYVGLNRIVTGSCGLREGFMFNYAVPQTIEKPISDVLGHSLMTYVKTLEQDQKHCEQVFFLCVQLFKQLRVLHKFPRGYIKILRIASFMVNAGKRFKFYQNQKHAAYMILNSNIFGVTHHDLVMSALITEMYPTGDVLQKDWERFGDIINDEDMEIAKKLAVIFKLAVAFDKSMSGAITEINCDVLGDSVIMKIEVNGDASLEIREAAHAAVDFRRIFKKNLDIL
ncbi:MAG: Ppx/GppA family phosphatase [Clostridia bacterium]|nr:Ppx/GppA family phosphatase [Clostridia bacterium]